MLYMQFLAAMTCSPGCCSDIPRRLKRHFAIVHCAAPGAQLLDHILTTTCASHFNDERDFTVEVQEMVVKLVPLTRKLWEATKV